MMDWRGENVREQCRGNLDPIIALESVSRVQKLKRKGRDRSHGDSEWDGGHAERESTKLAGIED